jgi:hypothetical protein
MTEPDSIVRAQMEALLRRVAREQETQSRRARDAAEEQARSIVARAWEEARTRLRQAVEEERRDIEHAVADRRAALETANRQREQAVLRELIDEAWRDLPSVLAGSWEQPGTRRAWCAAACAVARECLNPNASLSAEIDSAAPEDAGGAITAALGGPDRPTVEVRRIEGIGPGLRIRGGLACVDATVTGLLASRERIEAELLAELGRLLEQRGKPS